MKLAEYVQQHARRGACRCGRCLDAPDNPEDQQPSGHTVSVEFFEVSRVGGDKDEFLALVQKEFPHWLNGNEHNYLETGADIGDQGLAMMTMALGKLLGAWYLLTPTSIIGDDDNKDLRMQLAGAGYITIKVAA